MRLTRFLFLVSLLALVVVPIAAAIRFTDESFVTPIGTVGQAYRHQFDGAAGCGPEPGNPNSGLPYQFRILSGELPPGLSMSKQGLVSGTPTKAGEWTFWVELSDEDPPSAPWCTTVGKAERQFTIKVVPGLSVQQQSLAPTFLNETYSLQLTASGGGTQTWSVQSGTVPPGITLAPNGLLSGTPTTAGDYTFVVKVTDGTRTDTETLTLIVVPRLATATPKTPLAEVGILFSATFTATGGRAPYTWSLTNGTLPPGLALNPATGVISGTPSAAGPFNVTLSVKDALGLTAPVNAAIVVAAKLAITTKTLKPAKEGKKYLAKIVTQGGAGQKAFKLRGKLASGLRFNAKTGVISGTPAKAGTFRMTFEVTDRLGAVAKVKLALKVLA